jgi:hypothetical protein
LRDRVVQAALLVREFGRNEPVKPFVLHRAPAHTWKTAAMQSFIVGIGLRAANRRIFWRTGVLAAALFAQLS